MISYVKKLDDKARFYSVGDHSGFLRFFKAYV